MMDTPGSILKTEREKQNKSLESISGNTKIKIEFLRAIENDDYEHLPAGIFTKAYLRLYSEALGINGEYVLGLYKPKDEAVEVEIPARPQKKEVASLLKNISLPGFRPLIIAAVILMVILSAVLIIKYKGTETQTPFVSDVEKGKEEEAAAGKKAEGLSLKIEAVELTWVSIRIDEGMPEEWLLRPGEDVSVSAVEGFAVKIGNAGGTRVIFNGRDIGKLGKRGKVVDIVLPDRKTKR